MTVSIRGLTGQATTESEEMCGQVLDGAGGFAVDFSIRADSWDQTSPVARDWMVNLDLADIPLG
ncbi:MAG: hypothetical protein LBJ08_04005 [Bifidobacteriaceae bacterium]|jgi:hypothetical protein|nr:hypothetical protein [Bifidobacteriaceae bacterium]